MSGSLIMLNYKKDLGLISKQLLGQYYTTTDPFNISDAFKDWYKMVPKDVTFLEPFAGGGHLFKYIDVDWDGYDIAPNHPDVEQRDTLKEFPTEYNVCITNPPYLAKTVVSRKKLPVVLNHEDLYLDALQLCLDNCDYVAAIIPSTFWNQGLFKDRLYSWDKFDMRLFSDTDNPAGVAYFVPYKVENTKTYINGKHISLNNENTPTSVPFDVKFNPPDSYRYIINGIDRIDGDNIHIKIGSVEYKNTNRNIFSIHSPHIKDEHLQLINDAITEYRVSTNDFYLTSFKSLQKNGKYRKRISFKEVRWLLYKVLGSESGTCMPVEKVEHNPLIHWMDGL